MPPRSKSLLSLVLAFVVTLSCVPFASAQDIAPLTNADIVTMVRAKLPPALIIEKINTSSCMFDTFPSVLAELKYKGVPDDVLMAMVQAPHGARASAERSAVKSVPVAVATGSDSQRVDSENNATASSDKNTGGVIFADHAGSPYNARFYVAPMDEGFDGLIAAFMVEKHLPVSVVADESLADFIVVGGTNKGIHKWYDTVFTGYERDRAQGNIRVIRVRDKTVIWAAQKGDRSLWWGPLKKGGKRKVAERLVNETKGDLFKSGF